MSFAERSGIGPAHYEKAHFGEFGRIEVIGGRLICHICGRDYRGLQSHVWYAHGLLADEYKEAFGLNRSTPLVSADISVRQSELRTREGSARRLKPAAKGSKPPRRGPLRIEARRKQSIMMRDHPERTRAATKAATEARIGKPLPERTIMRLRKTMLARWSSVPKENRGLSDEHRRKIGDGRRAYLATHPDAKRRFAEAARGHRPSPRFGSANPASKLTERDIRSIHEMRSQGLTQKAVAERFGISRSLVSQIDRGHIWAHVR